MKQTKTYHHGTFDKIACIGSTFGHFLDDYTELGSVVSRVERSEAIRLPEGGTDGHLDFLFG